MPKNKPLFRIYNPATDSFSTGGRRPGWSARGTIFHKAALKSHLSHVDAEVLQQNSNGSGRVVPHPYANCEVQEIEYAIKNSDPFLLWRQRNP